MNPILNTRQATYLFTLFYLGSAILVIPGTLSVLAKSDAWLSALFAIGIHFALLPIYIALGKQVGQLSFTDYLSGLLGKWMGKILIIAFVILYPYLTFILTLRDLGDFTTTMIMRRTPMEPIMLLMAATVAIGVYWGLRTLGRSAEMMLPLVLFFLVVVFLSLLPSVHWSLLEPIGAMGIKPIVHAAFPIISYPFFEAIFFVMLHRYLSDKKAFAKILLTSSAISGIVFFLITIIVLMVIGGQLTSHLVFPTYFVIRTISLGGFYERIEAIVTVTWYLTIFFRLAVCMILTTMGLAEALSLKDHRILLAPMTFMSIPLAVQVSPNTIALMDLNNVWPYYSLILGVLLPLCFLAIDKIKNRSA